MLIAGAVITPYPPSNLEAELQRSLEAWLPGQGLNKSRLLMEYNIVKHDNDFEVSRAAMKRACPGGSSWRVPLTQNTFVRSGSGLHPVLTNSPWVSEPPTTTDRGGTPTIQVTAESTKGSRHQSLVPVPTISQPHPLESEISAPVSVVVNRVDSAPYYNRRPSKDSFDENSTSAWEAEKRSS